MRTTIDGMPRWTEPVAFGRICFPARHPTVDINYEITCPVTRSTAMAAGKGASDPIPKEELWDDFYANLHMAYGSLKDVFDRSGETQDEIASRLGCDKSLVSKRLNGRENLTLKTLS